MPAIFDGDVLNFVLPTHFTWAGGAAFAHISQHFRGNDAEAGAYLGIPTLVIVAWFALGARRSAAAALPARRARGRAVLTLGTGLVVKGHIEAWLPWRARRGPAARSTTSSRRVSASTSSLVAAVIVALWTASRHGWARWVLPALAVAAIVPDVTKAYWTVHPERWAFFTDKTYRICFPKNENVAIFPFGFWGDSMLWQAESGFWFRMPEGYLAPDPPDKNLKSDPLIRMATYTLENPTPIEIIAFAKNKKVDRIVSVKIYIHPNGHEMRHFGQVQDSGGVLVSPACGYPSMQKGIHPSTRPGD